MSIAIKVLKVRCPACDSEHIIQVTPEVLREADQNPLGLTGLAFPHGDHVLVVYVDRLGGERGTRVFRLFQQPAARGFAEVRVPPSELQGLRNIGGFWVELGRLGVRVGTEPSASAVSLKAKKGATTLELDFNRDIGYQTARLWLEMLLDAFDTSYSSELRDYVNAVKALDLLLEEKPFEYARQVLWLLSNASTITIRLRMPEARLLREVRPSLFFERYDGGFVLKVLESSGSTVGELLSGALPQVLFSSAEAILALHRRGVIDLVVT
uniref:Uncharacterized protein n=2 Tax=Thermofilum pendens TaxID=2269 RepID=A0A7J3X568_THEPE